MSKIPFVVSYLVYYRWKRKERNVQHSERFLMKMSILGLATSSRGIFNSCVVMLPLVLSCFPKISNSRVLCFSLGSESNLNLHPVFVSLFPAILYANGDGRDGMETRSVCLGFSFSPVTSSSLHQRRFLSPLTSIVSFFLLSVSMPFHCMS